MRCILVSERTKGASEMKNSDRKSKAERKIYMKLKTALKRISACILAALTVLVFSRAVFAASEYGEDGATSFVFSEDGITVSEGDYTDYKIDGTALTIKGGGIYVVSGSCSDGSITVKKGVTGVTLVLNGLDLTSASTAPIACNKSSEVTLTAAQGTVNTLTDSAQNNDENFPDNELAENAVIKCKDGSKVVLSGSGTLNIVANGKNGIKSGATTETEGEASLTIKELTLNINASVNDAINAEQLLNVESGTLTINAADDGIHCDLVMNVGADGTTGPTIKINGCNEGLEAATLNIYSGNITVHAEDDCLNAANSDLTDYEFSVNISGGALYMDSVSGDGIDSNGTLTVSGGTVVVWTANTADNQPLDADGVITVSGGTVLAAGGSSGMGMNLSASQPYVIFGSSAQGGQPGGGQIPSDGQQPPEMPSDGNQPSGERPTGGQPSDGQQPPEMPSDGNQPSGERPTGGQPSDGIQPGGQGGASVISANSTVTVKDSSGNTVYIYTAPCAASYVFFSSADLTSGETYTLYADNTSVATATAGTEATSEGQPGGQASGQPDERPTGDPQNPPDGSSSETPSDGSSSQTDPDTSDGSNTALWITTACISATLVIAAVVVTVVEKKKRS